MYRYYLAIIILTSTVIARSQDGRILNSPINVYNADSNLIHQERALRNETVELKVFYECLCPGCIELDPVVGKVAETLRGYLNVHTYPFGNAFLVKADNGTVIVICPHGKGECYGNMLHACALNILPDHITALQYNGCMSTDMSDDAAAVKCGENMGIPFKNVQAIMDCAKGPKGRELLIHYGKETIPYELPYVPYMLINGVKWSGDYDYNKILKSVCAKFTKLPKPCK